MFILGLLFIILMLWLGFKITGVLLTAIVWLFIMVPLAFIVCTIGIICCCTIILIPVGLGLFRTGLKFMIPGI